jgi:16S rRNA (adenine1518-N6/adenine1519-N6)-dimethyltransferase
MSLRAKKSFGQNFLNSPRVVTAMIQASQVHEGDLIIEVGPGKGVLTKALLATGARVIAFEIDPRMIEHLQEIFAEEIKKGKLEIVAGDILEQDLKNIIGNQEYKLIANIPYYITNAILRYFLSGEHQPTKACVLVQHEVAERVARDPKESILSLSIKIYGTPKYLTKVSRRYFTPSPKVDSAVLFIDEISRNNFTHLQHEENFFACVKQAFAHRRKQFLTNIASSAAERHVWENLLAERGYQSNVRAEDIKLDDWIFFSRQGL